MILNCDYLGKWEVGSTTGKDFIPFSSFRKITGQKGAFEKIPKNKIIF